MAEEGPWVAEVVLEFTFERETKNTVRFQEAENADGEPPAIGTLYVQKWVLKRLGDPKRLSVVVRGADAPAAVAADHGPDA